MAAFAAFAAALSASPLSVDDERADCERERAEMATLSDATATAFDEVRAALHT